MVTSIRLLRVRLITKEKTESFCKGEEDEKDSVLNHYLKIFGPESLFEKDSALNHYLKIFDLEKN